MESSGFEKLLPAKRSRTKCIRAKQWSAAANKIKHNFPVDKERWKSCYGGENNQFVKLANRGEKKTKHEKKEMVYLFYLILLFLLFALHLVHCIFYVIAFLF